MDHLLGKLLVACNTARKAREMDETDASGIDKATIEAYRTGCYVMPVPPAYTGAWREIDWIRYIMRNGGFKTKKGV